MDSMLRALQWMEVKHTFEALAFGSLCTETSFKCRLGGLPIEEQVRTNSNFEYRKTR